MGRIFGPVGVTPVKLRVDQRRYIDPVDQEVVDLAVDPGVDQLDTAHDDSGHVDAAEPGVGKVDGAELRTWSTRPKCEPLRSSPANSAMGRTLATPADRSNPTR